MICDGWPRHSMLLFAYYSSWLEQSMLTLYQVGKLNMVLRFLKYSCKPIFIPCALIYCSNNAFMDEGNQVGVILLMFLGARRRDLTRAVMQRNLTAGCRGDYANLYSHCGLPETAFKYLRGVIWCRLMTSPPSRSSGRLVQGCLFLFLGTLQHTAAQTRTRKSLGRTKGRSLNWREVWCAHAYTHTHTYTHTPKHTHRFMHSDEKRDRCTPPFQPAPHLGDGYFRKEHNIRTHIHSTPDTHTPTSFPLAPSRHQLLSSLSF